MKRISSEELKEMRSSGAKVISKKKRQPASKPVAHAAPLPGAGVSAKDIAKATTEANAPLYQAMVERLSDKSSSPKLTPWRFTINRDNRGLISTVDAHPIED